MFYIDPLYIIIMLPAIIFAGIASAMVKSTFQKYSKIPSRRGITGASAARRVLDANGLYHVAVERVAGDLTDHYDPRANVIRLSDATYHNTSAAAIGVAAHEAGHAVQHAVGYAPIKIRTAIIPVTNLGAKLTFPLILIGILLSQYGAQYITIAYAGILCFSFSTLFQLVTLPTEFNASRRAMEALDTYGILDREELGQTKKVLTAAALTYVAALAHSLANLLYLFMMVNRNDRR